MKISSKLILAGAALAVIALAFVACSDSGDETTSTVSIPRSSEFQTQEAEFQTEEAEYGQYGVCYEPTESLREGVARTLARDDLGARAFFMVRQPYDSISWTIAFDIEGPGLEGEGPIALLDANGHISTEIGIQNVQPRNVATLEHTTLETSLGRDIAVLGDVFERLYEKDRVGIELIQDCLREELATNPDTKVYGLSH